MQGRGFELEAKPPVQIGELIRVMCLDRSRPRPHLLIHVSQHRRRGMQREMPAERREGNTGAQQDGR